MKLAGLFVVLLASVFVIAQEPKFFPVQLRSDGLVPAAIHFYCSQGYDPEECLRDTSALRTALALYPMNELGSWSYYLVLPFQWKPVAVSHGGDGVSPAFSMLLGRATVLDRSLFYATADRRIDLEKWSGIPWGPQFVAVALSHELAHAICQQKNERLANEYAEQLRSRKIPSCIKNSDRIGPTLAGEQKPQNMKTVESAPWQKLFQDTLQSNGGFLNGRQTNPQAVDLLTPGMLTKPGTKAALDVVRKLVWRATAMGAKSPNQPGASVVGVGNQKATLHADEDGVTPTVAPVPLQARPEILAALNKAWTQAKLGMANTEAGFYVDKDGGINMAPQSNEFSRLPITISKGTTSLFHTHPSDRSKMSAYDMQIANKQNVEVYVLSKDGLYYYRPGMKAPNLVQIGTDFLSKKGGK